MNFDVLRADSGVINYAIRTEKAKEVFNGIFSNYYRNLRVSFFAWDFPIFISLFKKYAYLQLLFFIISVKIRFNYH